MMKFLGVELSTMWVSHCFIIHVEVMDLLLSFAENPLLPVFNIG